MAARGPPLSAAGLWPRSWSLVRRRVSSVTNRDEVTIILGDHKNEAVDALCTPRDNVVGAPRVNIRVHEPAPSLSLIGRSVLDLADELNLYPGWSDLLKAVRQPPKLVETLA